MREYCNPLDISYKFQHYRQNAHREAADPTLVYFKGRYYLFASMSMGFYHSDDLVHWQWHENQLEPYGYAPDVRQKGEYLYFCSSGGNPSLIWRTKDPIEGRFEQVSAPLGFWDPDVFFDDDGKAYLFWGSSDRSPIYGVELDSETMMPVGEPQPVLAQDISAHGWERNNDWEDFDNKYAVFPDTLETYAKTKWKTSFLEGAYLTKYNGRYYLQYAAPGTELSVYGDGYHVAEHPLGPYTFAPNTPFSLKPSGFITGAGHGSTIADAYGNLWHASTMCINVHAPFERRVGLFPAGVSIAPLPDYDGGAAGMSFALFCCPAEQALERIGLIEEGEGLPHPMIDGEWAKTSRKAMGAYLIAEFGTGNLQKMLEYTKRAGLTRLYHPEPFKDWGHFTLRPEDFPQGDVSAEDTELRVIGTALFETSTSLQTVRVEEELVTYQTTQDGRLTGCQRGAFGTRPAAHAAGSEAFLLCDYPYKVFSRILPYRTPIPARTGTPVTAL